MKLHPFYLMCFSRDFIRSGFYKLDSDYFEDIELQWHLGPLPPCLNYYGVPSLVCLNITLNKISYHPDMRSFFGYSIFYRLDLIFSVSLIFSLRYKLRNNPGSISFIIDILHKILSDYWLDQIGRELLRTLLKDQI